MRSPNYMIRFNFICGEEKDVWNISLLEESYYSYVTYFAKEFERSKEAKWIATPIDILQRSLEEVKRLSKLPPPSLIDITHVKESIYAINGQIQTLDGLKKTWDVDLFTLKAIFQIFSIFSKYAIITCIYADCIGFC